MEKAKSLQESRESLDNELISLAEKRDQLKTVVVRNPENPNHKEIKELYWKTVQKMKRICDELSYDYYEHEPIKEKKS